jgi:hypothetical protein
MTTAIAGPSSGLSTTATVSAQCTSIDYTQSFDDHGVLASVGSIRHLVGAWAGPKPGGSSEPCRAGAPLSSQPPRAGQYGSREQQPIHRRCGARLNDRPFDAAEAMGPVAGRR